MCSYTLKDLDYYSNFKEERIKHLLEQSYPKPENDKKELETECMNYIKDRDITDDGDEYSYPHYIGMYTIDFLRSKN